MTKRPIIDSLREWNQAMINRTRWHTPGHKGSMPLHGDFLQWEFDATEVGILTPAGERNPIRQSEDLMAQTYGVLRTWYSVSGATLGVMTALLAAAPFGSEIVVERSSHRAVLAGIILGGLHPVWVFPRTIAGLPVPGSDDDFLKAITSRTRALVMTSPTYDGLVADRSELFATIQERGIVVIVDEAHGSHFFNHEGFPPSAIQMGADVVIHGNHKMESTLTQTGLLHRNTPRIDETQIEYWWQSLSTSSPSYLLLAALDRLQWERHQPFYHEQWESFADQVRRMLWPYLKQQGLDILQPLWEGTAGSFADPAKLTLLGNGQLWQDQLRASGSVEKYTAHSVTLILSPYQDLNELKQVLVAASHKMASISYNLAPIVPFYWPHPQVAMAPHRALSAKRVKISIDDAVGEVAVMPITPYPPGIPLIMPGEIFEQDVIDWIRQGDLSLVEGLIEEKGDHFIWVIKN